MMRDNPNKLTINYKNTTLEVNEDVVEPKSRVNFPKAFNHATNALLPLKLVLWTLAIMIVPAVIVLGWIGDGLIKLVRIGIPLLDRAITSLLEGIVWLTELLWGTDFDEYSESYLEVKHLLRN